MRSLERNKRQIYYALYLGKEDILDSDGNKAGDKPLYGDKTVFKINTGISTGKAKREAFGNFTDYDRILCVTGSVPFDTDEANILWIDNLEAENADYVITKIAKSVNTTLIAVRKKK